MENPGIGREELLTALLNLLKSTRMARTGFDSLLTIAKAFDSIAHSLKPFAPRIAIVAPILRITVGMYAKTSEALMILVEKLADATEAEIIRLRANDPPPSGSDISKN